MHWILIGGAQPRGKIDDILRIPKYCPRVAAFVIQFIFISKINKIYSMQMSFTMIMAFIKPFLLYNQAENMTWTPQNLPNFHK